MHVSVRHSAKYWISVLGAICLAGCATHRAAQLEHKIPDADAKKQAILADIQTNAAQLQSMAALANFTFVQRKDDTRSFQGSVMFKQPDKLYVRGNHYPSGAKIFEMASNGSQWYADFAMDNQFYSSRQEHAGLAVTPLDIARELFFPDDWKDAAQIILTKYDTNTGQAELLIRAKKSLVRKVALAGPPWTVVESVMLDHLGREVVKTSRGAYHEENGIRFPFDIRAEFPTENASVTCIIRKAKFNSTDIPEDLFITR